MNDVKYWVAFNRIPGIGPMRFLRLLEYFGEMGTAWRASPGELQAAGLDARALKATCELRSTIEPEREFEALGEKGVLALTLQDRAYPARLKQIADPPPVLYVRGQILPQDEWAVAVVGTRQPDPYGLQVTSCVAEDLARAGITIISGLARGIDSAAHRAALEAGGRTLAVCGSGVDVIYPRDNARLATAIAERGALVSEFPLGTRPNASNFPQRNRVISGLSLGVLVTQAGDASGTHLTVRHALDQNRDVFAVPGSIFAPLSRGCHRWIQEGAKLVRSAQDILEELNLSMLETHVEMRETLPADDTEALLLHHLSLEPMHIDEVGRRSGLPISTVSSALTLMELKGMVRHVGAMNYALTRA